MVRSPDLFRYPVERDVIVASVAANLLALALPLVLLQIYDRIIPNKGYETLAALAIGLFVAIALDVVLKNARAAIMAWSGSRFENHLTERAVSHLLTGDLVTIEKDPPGAHLDRLKSIDRIRDFRTGEAATAYLDIPFAFMFLMIVALISPSIALVILAIAVSAILVTRRIDEAARALIEQRNDVDTRRHSFLIEVLKSIETVKSLGIGAFMERRYERLMGTAAGLVARSSELSNLSQGITGSMTQLATAAVAAFGAILVIDGSLTVGALAATILLAGRVLQPLFKVELANSRSEEIKLAEGRLAKLFDGEREHVGGLDPGSIETISLRQISFAHSPEGPPILDSIDLDLRRGEMVAISGASGSGKSTLLWLMTGALRPTSGEVMVNGYDLRDCDLRVLRHQISLLPQRHTLLDGTVIENMTRFDPERYAPEALRIATALGLDRFFAAHPQGLSGRVRSGETGDMPASVVDRIALVRGLVNTPRVILFDESNQSLDRDADVALLRYLESQRDKAAIVLITQRPSYAAIADRRFKLLDGHLVEERRSAAPRDGRADDAGMAG